jgi:thiosulfate dehydrogenase
MKFSTFAIGSLAICLAIGGTVLLLHTPASVPRAPESPQEELIAYGDRLVNETFAVIGPNVSDPAMRFAGNNLACKNCHLDGGTNRSGLPLLGVFKTYPKFSNRDKRVISLAERVNECMTRSMNGRALPEDSREMMAYLAHLRSLDDAELVAEIPAPPPLQPADAARGAEVYSRVCAACHQADGRGVRLGSAGQGHGYQFPPLWGPDSFNDGAGMDRFERSVAFIRNNMPRGVDAANPQLSLQEAWDVAAYVIAQPRPRYRPP